MSDYIVNPIEKVSEFTWEGVSLNKLTKLGRCDSYTIEWFNNRTARLLILLGIQAQAARLHLAPLGTTWLLLYPLGSTHLVHLGPLGSTWAHLGPLGSTWVHLGPPGSTWAHMGPHGFTWIHLGPLWSTWVNPDPLGSTWVHLGQPGSTYEIGAVAQCPYNWGVGSAFHPMKIHI